MMRRVNGMGRDGVRGAAGWGVVRMMMLLVVGLVVEGLLGDVSGASGQDGKSAKAETGTRMKTGAEPEQARYTFRLPVPATASVRARVTRNGKVSEMTYVMSMTALRLSASSSSSDATNPDAARFAVGLRDFTFERLRGVDVRRPAMQRAFQTLMARVQAVPDGYVDLRGRLVDVESPFDMLARITKVMKQSDDGPAIRALKTSILNEPEEHFGKPSVHRVWRGWVELWTHEKMPAPGRSVDVKSTIAMWDRTIPAALRLENLGPAEGHLGHVRLRATLVADAVKAREAKLARLGDSIGREQAEAEILGIDLSQRYVAVVNPRTLRPATARFEEIVVETRPKRRAVYSERRDHGFGWRP